MNQYKVFENKDQKYGKRVIALEVGWSFYALIFGPIWAGFKNLNSHWIISSLLIMAAAIYHSQILALIVWIVTGIILAFLGNEIRATKLEEKSYKLVDTLVAKSVEEAQDIYLSIQEKTKEQALQERWDLAEELKENDHPAKVKQDDKHINLLKRDLNRAAREAEANLIAEEEKLDEVKQSDGIKDKTLSPEQKAISSLINKEITTNEYMNIKIQLAELKEQEKSTKVAKLVQLEKAKKLPDNDDDEFYLIATKEIEGSDRNEALWAKCMATQMGDVTKAKYCYVNKRVESLKQEAEDKAEYRIMLDAKIRLEIYLSIERNISSASEKPEYDLASDNLFPNSPNDFYREKITSQFKEKVKERLEKEINLNNN